MVLNSTTMSDAAKPSQEAEVGDRAEMADGSSAANNLASLKWNKSAHRLPRRPAKSPAAAETGGALADKKAGKAVAVDVEEADGEEVTSTMSNLRPMKRGRLTRSERTRTRTSVDAKIAAETKERMRFSLSLSKEEIEEDFLLMTGAKPTRRPTRRNKKIQKDVDNLCPGSWMEAPLPDMYKTRLLTKPNKD